MRKNVWIRRASVSPTSCPTKDHHDNHEPHDEQHTRSHSEKNKNGRPVPVLASRFVFCLGFGEGGLGCCKLYAEKKVRAQEYCCRYDLVGGL